MSCNCHDCEFKEELYILKTFLVSRQQRLEMVLQELEKDHWRFENNAK
jgi:hypothetical protein